MSEAAGPGVTVPDATPVTWVLEPDVFPPRYAALRHAVQAAGHRAVTWQDAWWRDGGWPRLRDSAVVFHGSLGNAARIAVELPWRPGAFCRTDAFRCSAWYDRAAPWLLHRAWVLTSASRLAADPAAVVAPLGAPASVFVRPDSPLKPFSGRVLPVDGITLGALDHGFYFDDPDLPVVVAPVREVTDEWRYVVVDGRVVAGSRYQAAGREPLPDDPSGAPWAFAAEVAARLAPPDAVYVLDVCASDAGLRLLELNPFSGADLYACDAAAVVGAVSARAGFGVAG